jgi:ADP-ribose pyrophosphatase YjhB (NUDIX family)
VRLWSCPIERARVEVCAGDADRAQAPELEDRIATRWQELTAQNPRLFDGPMLAIESFDAQRGALTCRRERYRRLAVQPGVDTGVRLLAVKGVVLRREAEQLQTLMIRRHPRTHMYGGMWEIGPAGGVDPEPGAQPYTIDHDSIQTQLARELREESGVVWQPDADAPLIAMFTSDESHCLNMVLRIELDAVATDDSARAWDADALEWVPVDSFSAFIERTRSDGIVPNSVALARFLGWLPR